MKSKSGVIHVVSEFVTPVNSTGYYWSRIIRRMAEVFGHVVVWYPDVSGRNIADAEWVVGVEPRPIRLDLSNKRKLFSRVLGELKFAFGFAWRLLGTVRKGDVVLSGTNPVLLILLLMLVRKVRRCEWVLVAYDVFPENMAAAGVASKQGILFLLLKKVFDAAYASASMVIVIGRDMRELMLDKGVSSSRVIVQPNWADPATVIPQSRTDSRLLAELHLEGRMVFQFFGNIGRVQGIENILQAISLVKNSNAAFLFIGEGAMVDVVKKHVPEPNGNPVIHIGNWPMKSNMEALSACDVAIVSLSKGMYGLGVPSKAYFSMAADKPLLVIADEQSELARVVNEDKVGWTCSPGDPQSLAKIIDEICESGTASLLGSPRRVLCEKFSENTALSRYAAVVSQLISGNKS